MDVESAIGVGLGAVLLCVGGLFAVPLLVLLSRKNAKLGREPMSWPATTGRVLQSRVVDARTYFFGRTPEEVEREWVAQDAEVPLPARLALDAASGDLLDSVVPNRVERGHWPLILYEYEVGGMRYTSYLIKADERGGQQRSGFLYSRKLVQRYLQGAAVTVCYNPQNPAQAILER